MSQPTGRARGRSRGRGRGTAPPPSTGAVRRPGEQAPPMQQQAPPPQEAEGMPVPGRGRSRGGTTQPGPGSIPQQKHEDVSSQIAQMHVGASGEGGVGGAVSERRARRGDVVIEPSTLRQGFDKFGSHGGAVPLVANAYKLKTMPNWQLQQYRVDFEPQILNPRARWALIRNHKEMLGDEMTLDMDTMYARVRLPEKVTNVTSERRDGSMVNIRITHAATLNPMAPNTLHLFNVLFRKVLKIIKMEQIGRHHFDPSSPIEVKQHRIQLWPGFVTSILQYEKDVLLMADISHKILRTDTVLEFMYDLMQKSRGNFREEAKKKIIGEIVLTRYNNNTYRVDDIDWDTHPVDSFETRDGSRITYMDYYRKTYDRPITDDKQPMLVSRPKKREEKKGAHPIYLVPELCYMTGLSEETRADFHVMRDIAAHTRVAPHARVQTLNTFINKLRTTDEVKTYMQKWGLEFDNKLVELNGRIGATEALYMQRKKFTYDRKTADWSRDMRGNALNMAIPLTSWVMIYTKRDANRANDFFRSLVRVGGPMGMNVRDPERCELADDRAETYTRALQANIRPDSTQMVVVILPTNRKDRYDAIKKICVVTHPVPSQVIVSRTLSKQQMLMSVATKIAMQINCKMGGDLWALEIPLKNLMVIGIDSYHDSASKGRSVCGFVASMNNSLTSYFSRCSFQHTHGELCDALSTHMSAALKRYHELNEHLPDRVIVFRDGVSDSQVSLVCDYELKQITSSMNKYYPAGTRHKLGVVVVKKRINNRFFLKENGSLSNPPPGTIIDSTITKKHLYDFFIVSQSVNRGTVSPTSYNVIHDETGLKADHMQRLTYKLTHLYFNWPGTVRVPAPCMYAHKLAFLIGQSVHTAHNKKLSDTLFYL